MAIALQLVDSATWLYEAIANQRQEPFTRDSYKCIIHHVVRAFCVYRNSVTFKTTLRAPKNCKFGPLSDNLSVSPGVQSF